jgi:sulfhydrogenase subunit delta
VLTAFLAGRKPAVSSESVCMECKQRGNVCVMVAHGTPCLGPVTHAGCGALCPTYDRGCYGCFGPKETPNTASLAGWWSGMGVPERELLHVFRGFNAYADAFREESEAHERAEPRED